MQTDRQTDTMKITLTFRDSANVPKTMAQHKNNTIY